MAKRLLVLAGREMMTRRGVERELGIEPRRVHQLVAAGLIKREFVDGLIVYDAEVVRTYKARRGERRGGRYAFGFKEKGGADA